MIIEEWKQTITAKRLMLDYLTITQRELLKTIIASVLRALSIYPGRILLPVSLAIVRIHINHFYVASPLSGRGRRGRLVTRRLHHHVSER